MVLSTFIKHGLKLKAKITPIYPAAVQQETTLVSLLQKAKDTAFGQHYQFDKILNADNIIKAYQSQVPIFDYNSLHQQWWSRTLQGESNVCWKDKPNYFALSSGTSGAPSKYIPITEEMIKTMRSASLAMFSNFPNFDLAPQIYLKPMMMLGGCTDLKEENGFKIGDLSGINASRAPYWIEKQYYRPGKKIAAIQDWNERIEAIAKNAKNWDIGYLTGIPSWIQLLLERIIAYHKVETIHDIWPNLSVFIHGGIAFEPYKKSFNQLLAKPLIYVDTYLASEGFIAFQARPETTSMQLLLQNNIFMEFIPFNEKNFDENGLPYKQAETLTINDVALNQDYALLISTCAGTWRYLIGDTIRFTDLERNEIVITGRTKHFLSLCGEHLSVDNMNQAIQALEEQTTIVIPEFTVSGIRQAHHFSHKWYLGCKNPIDFDKATIAQLLDDNLKSINDDYKTERSAVLKDITVELIPIDLFYKWLEQTEKMGGQIKFPRVMKSDKFERWEQFIKAQLGTNI